VLPRGHVSRLLVVPSASPVFPNASRETRAIFTAEEYVKGNGPAVLDLLAGGLPVPDDPNTGISAGEGWLFDSNTAGRTYLLFFTPEHRLDLDPGSCGGSFELDGAAAEQKLERIRSLATSGLPTSGGPATTWTPPGFPAAFFVISGAMAILSGAAFLWPRDESRNR
jgi:hypothetical protein